ncbi:von Willebrand factor D and EGF domain-containing protein-like isoform X2 [Argopecten irradians]|uniref:von Willebrand factor D and EGF domain-containing protein-like isoform X2 n=1 Tax=Argopecten irradians TaxID=31199 RepID=UPI0037174CA7
MSYVIFVFIIGLSWGNADPCTENSELPYADLRLVNNMYDFDDVAVDDRFLDPGWYRVKNEDMPMTMPAFLSCGTKFPIWLNGIGESGTKPPSIPSKPEVIVNTTLVGAINHAFKSRCKFDEIPGKDNLYYQVTWYIEGTYLTTLAPELYNSLTHIILDKNNLKSLGRMVSCSVRARKTPKGPPGLSVKSTDRYFGIEVMTPYIHIGRGSNGTIRLRPTVPIGCYGNNCKLNVAIYTETDTHGTLTYKQSSCAATINTTDWEKEIEITVYANDKDRHDVMDTVFDVALRTDRYEFHEIWAFYALPLVKVRVNDTFGLDNGACQANNDPHMVTFDQRPYDIQFPGDFIMYKHIHYPIQVQSRFRSCYGNGYPYCVFGVAVQAGKDLFVIDRSGNNAPAYTICMDSTLDVRRVNPLQYRIYTPIGSRVDVNIGNVRSKRITVHIYPSVRDKNSTLGLCGTLTNDCPDDFEMSDGDLFNNSESRRECESVKGTKGYTFQPDKFSRSWLVGNLITGDLNLFNELLDDDKLQAWNQDLKRCECKSNRTTSQHNVTCSSSMVSPSARNGRAEKQINLTKSNHCKRKIRTKRSIQTNKKQQEHYYRRRKKSVATTMIHMTEAEADAYCRSSLGNTKLFSLCGDVPYVKTEHAIQACIMDVMLSNTTDWTDSSRETLQDRCLSELQLNSTLERIGTAGHPSIAAAIREIACPGNCTSSGICVNGTCDCQGGFGGIDCSIDLSIPPYFEELLDNGMCDKQDWECDVAMVTGDDFIAEGNLRCKMEPFWVDIDGVMYTEQEETVPADIQTFMNLFCPLTLTRHKRDTSGQSVVTNLFVEAYNVSLSNDGIHFGDLHTLFIYDSKCQTVQLSGGQQVFLLKDNYCFIDNTCTDEYDINPENVCQMCNPAVSKYDWSTSKTVAECSPVAPGDESNNYLWVIGPVAGSFVAVAVIGAVIWRIKLRKVKRVGDSTLFSDNARPEQRT